MAWVLLGYGSKGRLMGNLRPQNSDRDCGEWQGHGRNRRSGVKAGLEMILGEMAQSTTCSSRKRKREDLSWSSWRSVQLPSVRDKGLLHIYLLL